MYLQEEIFALEDSVPVHYYPEGEQAVSASTRRPLDASNKGFQLLTRMGWGGKGLGRNEHGEPSIMLSTSLLLLPQLSGMAAGQ
jgi:hypothetical protein